MKAERTEETTIMLLSSTPVIIDGRKRKYVTEITFEPLNPLPEPFNGCMEFNHYISIEEAKRRWPNTPIPDAQTL